MPPNRRPSRPANAPTHPVAKRLEYVRNHYRVPSIKAFWQEVGKTAGCSYEAAKNYHTDREAPVSYLAAVLAAFPDVQAHYLLTGHGPRTKSMDRVLAAQDWTVGDVTDLRDNLTLYCAGVVMDRLAETHPGPTFPDGERTTHGTLVAAHDVLNLMRGDPLEHLSRHVRRLTDQLVAREQRQGDAQDAERWRAHVRNQAQRARKGAK